MEYVSATLSNPFGMSPPCESFVPGYGNTQATFHVVGDHPGVHGGESTGVPFTDCPWSEQFFETLERAGVIAASTLTDDRIDPGEAFLSYRHMCWPDDGTPSQAAYDRLDPYFDAELRAITADVLLPVGDQTLEHVLETYTARATDASRGADTLHAEEIRGAGWLVVPSRDPAAWTSDDADRLVATLTNLRETGYRQVADLGRFLPDEQSYFVR